MSRDCASPLADQATQCFEATARVVARHNAEHPTQPTTIDDELVAVLRTTARREARRLTCTRRPCLSRATRAS